MAKKVCVECNLEKYPNEFYRNILQEDGRTLECKHCRDGQAIDRYVALLEKDQERRKVKKVLPRILK